MCCNLFSNGIRRLPYISFSDVKNATQSSATGTEDNILHSKGYIIVIEACEVRISSSGSADLDVVKAHIHSCFKLH